LNKAQAIYEEIKKEYDDFYLLHFRLGELYFSEREIAKALDSFDKSKKFIEDDTKVHCQNKLNIILKIAYIYWLLGQEYIDCVLDTIKEADIFFDKHQIVLDIESYFVLVNNQVYYNLEKYEIEKGKGNN